MIVFDLECKAGHRFEGWFADAEAFGEQRDGGAIPCPYCGVTEVERVLSVPRIQSSTSSGRNDMARAVQQLAVMQAQMLKGSTWVGPNFATQARAMADGDQAQSQIHGQATAAEARELADEGIAVMPLVFPVVPPESRN